MWPTLFIVGLNECTLVLFFNQLGCLLLDGKKKSHIQKYIYNDFKVIKLKIQNVIPCVSLVE